MSVFLTGAGGFLGSAIIDAASEDRRDLIALFRPKSGVIADHERSGLAPVLGDLRQPGAWQEALSRASAVIHCAAAPSGDFPTQLAGTVLATENLLASLPAHLERFVHVSSFSVYDFSAPRIGGRLDEDTPLESRPLRRDAYTMTKLIQERMIRAHCRAMGIPLVVVRPGAIYRHVGDWDHGRALRAGPFDLIFAPLASMRLIHVEDCARAIIAALDAKVCGELVVNLIGDETTNHWSHHRRARRSGVDTGIPLPVPYIFIRMAGVAAMVASTLLFKGRARLPELLDLPRQQARWRPLRYSSRRAKAALNWSSIHGSLGQHRQRK